MIKTTKLKLMQMLLALSLLFALVPGDAWAKVETLESMVPHVIDISDPAPDENFSIIGGQIVFHLEGRFTNSTVLTIYVLENGQPTIIPSSATYSDPIAQPNPGWYASAEIEIQLDDWEAVYGDVTGLQTTYISTDGFIVGSANQTAFQFSVGRRHTKPEAYYRGL
jgi:hypothetical protein